MLFLYLHFLKMKISVRHNIKAFIIITVYMCIMMKMSYIIEFGIRKIVFINPKK